MEQQIPRVRAVGCDHRADDEAVYQALARATAPLERAWERLASRGADFPGWPRERSRDEERGEEEECDPAAGFLALAEGVIVSRSFAMILRNIISRKWGRSRFSRLIATIEAG